MACSCCWTADTLPAAEFKVCPLSKLLVLTYPTSQHRSLLCSFATTQHEEELHELLLAEEAAADRAMPMGTGRLTVDEDDWDAYH